MSEPLEFQLTDHDRHHLRTLKMSAGYGVMLKIAAAYLEAATEGAIAASRVDPLANQEAIARRWAYVAITEQVIESLKSGIDFELSLLNAKETPAPDPAEQARARRHMVLGYLDPLPVTSGEASTGANDGEMGVAKRR